MDMNNWLKEQRAHNRRQGTDYREMASYPNRVTLYTHNELRSTATALDLLLARLPHPGMRREEQRDKWEQERHAYVDSLVHVVYQLGNTLSALGVSDDEFQEVLSAHLHENRALETSLKADVGSWVCARCANEISQSVPGYYNVMTQTRVCSKSCLRALTSEPVPVPGPDVSAVDVSEETEEKNDLAS